MTDHERQAELQVLTTDGCYRLLAPGIGRLGVNAEHYPLIFPVNYALERDVIVMRMAPGTKLAAADHANVAFEVDEIDQRTRPAGACWCAGSPRRSRPSTGPSWSLGRRRPA